MYRSHLITERLERPAAADTVNTAVPVYQDKCPAGQPLNPNGNTSSEMD